MYPVYFHIQLIPVTGLMISLKSEGAVSKTSKSMQSQIEYAVRDSAPPPPSSSHPPGSALYLFLATTTGTGSGSGGGFLAASAS